MERPGGVVEVGPAERAHVGSAGQDDAVDVVVSADRADSDRGHARQVPDPVGERRLVASPHDRIFERDGLTRGHVNSIDPVGRKAARDLDGLIDRQSALVPVHS